MAIGEWLFLHLILTIALFPMHTELTIYDIAAALKISAATVSRALNNHPAISLSTKKKITDYAKKHGYRFNSFASNLRRQNSRTIGVIVPELDSRISIKVIAGIEKIARREGYDTLIANAAESYQQEVALANNFFQKRVDGIIASLAFDTPNVIHFDQFIKKNIPLVYFDRVEERSAGIKVTINNYKAAAEITNHLAAQGCKRILFVTGSINRLLFKERLRGYKASLKKNKIDYNKEYVLINNLTEQAGIETANHILKMKPLPDAVFITKDICAAVCMKALMNAGIQVPRQIAFAGFNNSLISRLTTPELTTIELPGEKMGEMAAEKLFEQIKSGKISIPHTITIQTKLVERASSLKKKPSKK